MARAHQADSTGLKTSIADAPAVVLAGRANVGKSTLFNRIAGGRAIVSPMAGTTRDLNMARTAHGGREFILIDSGGLESYSREPASQRAMEEALRAIAMADLVVLVVDGHEGVASGDQEALALIRETGRPAIVAANKVDNPRRAASAADVYSLGIESVTLVSAAHGSGVGELLDQIAAHLPTREAMAPENAPELRMALIGRPNVGKSSLLNRLSGFERAIVDTRPGTTRDPVDVRLRADGREVLLIDTAGIRRRTRVEGDLEHHSVGRAIETIRRADVLALVIDATEGITDQDARLARLVDSNDRAMILVCNKWDLAAKLGARVAAFAREARRRYPFLSFAPMLFTSAATGDGIDGIIPAAAGAGEAWRAHFQTSQLNRILAEATAALDPPLVSRRRLKLMYVTQIGSAPTRLAFFTNIERDIPAHYMRFLEGRFRAALGLEESGAPLRLEFRRTGRSWAESRAKPAEKAGGGDGAPRRKAAPH